MSQKSAFKSNGNELQPKIFHLTENPDNGTFGQQNVHKLR